MSEKRRINSRRKGAAGEREFAAELRRVLGVAARRGVQYSGSPESPDVVAETPGLHWEIKRVERFDLYGALDQATRDAGANETPVVARRGNRREWVVVVRFDDVPRFAERIAAILGAAR